MTQLINTLESRFRANMHRHPGMNWDDIVKKLKTSNKLTALEAMESTGGEPDVVGEHDGSYIFMDCSKESPTDRRSLCYDRAALDGRKENKPRSSVMDMATEMGVSLLTEGEYRGLQSIEQFDLKTSSWIVTPDTIRARGGALFCDRRYDTVFTYHNGADSYYAARGWRGKVTI